MTKLIVVVGLFLALTTTAWGQLSPKRMLELADGYQSVGRYSEALAMFQKYQEASPGNTEVLTNIGICLFETNQVTQARAYFESLSVARKGGPQVLLCLARTYHVSGDYQAAAAGYKRYLKVASDSDPDRPEVIINLRRCANGIRLQYSRSDATVEDMGPAINTPFDDFGAIQSPNSTDRVYFSSAREGNIGGLRTIDGLRDDIKGVYSSDMYGSRFEGTEWSKAFVFNTLLNSPREDILADFSSDGKKLYFFRGLTAASGQILVDTFKSAEERNLVSTEMNSPMDATRGDRDLFMFNDSICLFSSNREGGQGGYDIYVSLYIRKRWLPPINLGPAINTPFDEVTPCLAADGRTLYFSSDNTKTIGGFDIFKSKFSDLDRWWSPPANMGAPINSPTNDTHLRLSRDGSFGFLTSDRKSGMGMRDIYYISFNNSIAEQNTYSTPASFIEVILRPKGSTTTTTTNPVVTQPPAGTTTPPKTVEPIVTPPTPKETPVLVNLGTTTELYLNTLNYTGDGDIANAAMMSNMANIVETIKAQPTLHLILTGHSDPTGSPAHIDAYLVMKRVEKLATALIKAGLPAENIMLRSCGSSYPRAINKLNDAPYPAGQLLNRRIETYVFSTGQPLKTIRDSTTIGKSATDPSYAQNLRRGQGLTYRIEVGVIKGLYEGPDISQYSDIVVESQGTEGTYHYSVGIYPEFKAADTMRQELIATGFEQTNINAYLNGVPITIEEARRSTLAFPDLFNYLGYKSKN